MSNHLGNETSPYLQQHANNPVDWYPWGKAALDRARAEDLPLLISIGYSACHWCHVMAHESFENPEIARLMNDNFVNIKIDREERPDLDEVYMQSVVVQTGRGGWPLTVFATPEGKPFYGGTYFPPTDKHGLPGFPRVLQAISHMYKNQRNQIDESADQISATLVTEANGSKPQGELKLEILDGAFTVIKMSFDAVNGGFGSAPKFPQPSVLEFLMRYYYRTKDKEALSMITLTLDKMAAGGIYDQLGGGFHRYSTDGKWLVPHFEKMLYDNALLAGVYLHGYIITGDELYRRIAEETVDYVLREMADSNGGFYSSQDADSEHVEGKYYLWDKDEIAAAINKDDIAHIIDYYGITQHGHLDGRNILHVSRHLAEDDIIKQARSILLKIRDNRIKPSTDTKVLTGWNALMLASLSESACVLGRKDYLDAAVKNANFIMNYLTVNGQLRHSFAQGESKTDAFLQDYACLGEALLLLHQVTFDSGWLKYAIEVSNTIVEYFWDASKSQFFDVGKANRELFMQPRSIMDSPIPSGSSVASLLLLKMGLLTGDNRFRDIASTSIHKTWTEMLQSPLSTSHWLNALDYNLAESMEIVLMGEYSDLRAHELLHEICKYWLPNKVVAVRDPSGANSEVSLELLKDKKMINNKPTVYVCRGFICHEPVFAHTSRKIALN
jgi:uncharacterized protein YyaL (SSP411 family)